MDHSGLTDMSALLCNRNSDSWIKEFVVDVWCSSAPFIISGDRGHDRDRPGCEVVTITIL